MKIGILPILSSLHDEKRVNEATSNFIKAIEDKSGMELDFITFEQRNDYDLVLTFVETGGSENQFKKVYQDLPQPYVILTYGENNSLAASMEILSFIKRNNLQGEILHGSVDYIAKRLKALTKPEEKVYERLGVIGKPSDWLISSDVDYQEVKNRFGVELVDISLDKVMKEFNKTPGKKLDYNFRYDFIELGKSYKMYEALKAIKEQEKLDGLTIRCFDLIGPTKTTGCMALALLNKEGITATCEGDIPTMLTMNVARKLFNNPGFQANPSRIDVDNKEIVFAHCTLPLNMVKHVEIMSHFESNSGVALRGDLYQGPVTIFKIGANLKDYYVAEGELLANLKEPTLCRTQVKIKLDNVSYFLTNPLGNHHVIIYGHHKKEIEEFFNK